MGKKWDKMKKILVWSRLLIHKGSVKAAGELGLSKICLFEKEKMTKNDCSEFISK